MGFKCGLVGLPNVGKSTIFNALTSQHVPAENYPFCTTDKNIGKVFVPDKRLDDIANIFKPERVVPTTVDFVDIAGLVKNASRGEGLGNKFLSHIREVDAIAHIVRSFDAPNVTHIDDKVDPVRDIEIINTELILADIETLDRTISKIEKAAKSGDKKLKDQVTQLKHIKDDLNKGTPVRLQNLDEHATEALKDVFLLTTKPVLYVANVNENHFSSSSEYFTKLEVAVKNDNSRIIAIAGGIESELIDMSDLEKSEFLNDLGIRETGLVRLIREGYKLLDLITFFTKEGVEVKAWTVKRGTKAPQAAGKIHTDFEKGFIKADVFSYNDLITTKDEHKLRGQGKIRSEGHDYIIQDGDIVQFKFNI